MKDKFVHFGCWNNGTYNKNGKNPISKVLNYIIDTQDEYDFFVVAGDNYYPNKQKNYSLQNDKFIKGNGNEKLYLYSKTNHKKGINALGLLNKDVYLILGNHEIEPVDRLVLKNNINILCY